MQSLLPAKVAELEQTRKSAVKIQQLDAALDKNRAEREEYRKYVEQLIDEVPWRHNVRGELRGMDDPTLQMKKMLEVLERDTNYSQSIRGRAADLYREIDETRTGILHEDDDEMYKGEYHY